MLDAFNSIARYLENVTSATSAANLAYIGAEIRKLTELAEKYLRWKDSN